MSVTFLLGNGFDIGLNLDTRYSDFYPFYLDKKHDDMLSKDLRDNYERWADLELALGKCLAAITEDEIEEFLDSKATLEADLVEYLRLEAKRVSVDQSVAIEFRDKVVGFYKELNEQQRNDYNEWLTKRKSPIKYGFITFNYTDALDRVINVTQKQLSSFSSHWAGGVNYGDQLISPLHIHGTLNDDLILGVNDSSQVANEGLRNNGRLLDYFIKEAVNRQLGEQRIEKAEKIIDQSTYLCIFGLSLGETDRRWWEYIIEWLKGSSQRRLILYVYEDKSNNPSAGEKLRIQNRHRIRFFNQTNASPEVVQQLKSRVIVIVRSSIFTLKNVKVALKNHPKKAE